MNAQKNITHFAVLPDLSRKECSSFEEASLVTDILYIVIQEEENIHVPMKYSGGSGYSAGTYTHGNAKLDLKIVDRQNQQFVITEKKWRAVYLQTVCSNSKPFNITFPLMKITDPKGQSIEVRALAPYIGGIILLHERLRQYSKYDSWDDIIKKVSLDDL
ncbi:hypothetical protein [Chitinophaga sp. CB10]|uniref:hypothetical protein n=1 Tax=Chitinophaga sp. CB10 TaxID=1891659 RepID=UPI0025C647B6|nr:hypothetical protein [Chitinophaga sp. CB10]